MNTIYKFNGKIFLGEKNVANYIHNTIYDEVFKEASQGKRSVSGKIFNPLMEKKIAEILSSSEVEIFESEDNYATCNYCNTVRPIEELEEATIWVNHRQRTSLYCSDKGCSSYAQMGAEG